MKSEADPQRVGEFLHAVGRWVKEQDTTAEREPPRPDKNSAPADPSLGTKQYFAEWLAREREKRSWSQSQLARRAGMSRSVINQVERQQFAPSPSTLQSIARALGYPIEQVYRLAGYLPPVPELDPLVEEGAYILGQLEGEDKEDAIQYLRFRLDRQRQRRKKSAASRR